MTGEVLRSPRRLTTTGKGQQITRFRRAVPVSVSEVAAFLPEGGTMESPSAPAHRRCVPWQGLLLTASLLTLWSLPTTAQLTIKSVPPNAVEGMDVLFRVHNPPGNIGSYNWYKGETEDNNKIGSYVIDTQATISGPANSGRETIYHNGSLLFQNVTLNDTGKYILQTIGKDFQTKQVTGQLHVYQPVGKPTLRASNATVREHKSLVVLTCLTNDTGISIRWLFKNQNLQLTDRMKLSQDNSTLTINPVRRVNAGDYQCEVFNPASSGISDPYRLDLQCDHREDCSTNGVEQSVNRMAKWLRTQFLTLGLSFTVTLHMAVQGINIQDI